MRARLLTAAALIALTACTEDPFSLGEVRTFAAAQNRWNGRSFVDYTFQVRSQCFCDEEHVQWREVEVRNGVVTAVRVPGETTSLPANRIAEWPTVDGLFQQILQAAGGDHDYLDDISVQYDQALGFPARIHIDAQDNVADGGAVIEARAVVPLP